MAPHLNATDFTNNAVIPMVDAEGRHALLYQYGTQNNPSLVEHGSILQASEPTQDWTDPPESHPIVVLW